MLYFFPLHQNQPGIILDTNRKYLSVRSIMSKRTLKRELLRGDSEHTTSDVTIRRELQGVLNRYATERQLRHHIVIDSVSPVMTVNLVGSMQTVITGDNRGKARLWDMTTGKCTRTISGNSGKVSTVAVTTDGKYAVTGGWPHPGDLDYTAKVWDLTTGRRVHTLVGHKEGVSSVSFTPDDKHIVTCSGVDETVKLWDVETGRCLQTYTDGKKRFPYVLAGFAITPDGRQVITGHQGIRDPIVWNLASGAQIKYLKRHDSGISSVCITTDGKRLIAGDFSGTIKIWDMANDSCVMTLRKHSVYTAALAVTADGNRLVSVDVGDHVILWDLSSGECLETYNGNKDDIRSVVFSQDEKYIAINTSEGIRFLNAENLELLATLYNIHRGFLWSTPPDEYSPNGWFWTDREDLIRVFQHSENGNIPEYLAEDDPARRNYIQTHNNQKMVMSRFRNMDEYRMLADMHRTSVERKIERNRYNPSALLPGTSR